MISIRDLNDFKFDWLNRNEQKYNQKFWYQWEIELKKTDREELKART